jgi:hypothetical protein
VYLGGYNYKENKKGEHKIIGYHPKTIWDHKSVCVVTHSIIKLMRTQLGQLKFISPSFCNSALEEK